MFTFTLTQSLAKTIFSRGYGAVALVVTGKIQNKTRRDEFLACRDKLVGGTTLQVVFKSRQVNHGKPKMTVIGDLLHQINDRKLK